MRGHKQFVVAILCHQRCRELASPELSNNQRPMCRSWVGARAHPQEKWRTVKRAGRFLATALLTLQVVCIPLEDLVGAGQEMESRITKTGGGIRPPSQMLSSAGMQRVALGSGDSKGKGKRMG
jgi:hypothetical protein